MKVAVSACLLGTQCRFDGGHKRSLFVTDVLNEYVEFVPFCPEEKLLGTPRESMRLIQHDRPRAFGNKSGQEYTEGIEAEAEAFISKETFENLRGVIFKAKSPSCGMERAKIYTQKGDLDHMGAGLFARTVITHAPMLPAEEEGRLEDPWLRENFMLQLFAYDDLLNFIASKPTMADLVMFHRDYKFLLLSKSEHHYRLMGPLVGNQEKRALNEILEEYEVLFKKAIAEKSTKKKMYNTIEHLYGFLKTKLTADEKEAFKETFEEFKSGIVPLIAPMKMLGLYAKRYDVDYLLTQKIFHPYPDVLGLRSDTRAFK